MLMYLSVRVSSVILPTGVRNLTKSTLACAISWMSLICCGFGCSLDLRFCLYAVISLLSVSLSDFWEMPSRELIWTRTTGERHHNMAKFIGFPFPRQSHKSLYPYVCPSLIFHVSLMLTQVIGIPQLFWRSSSESDLNQIGVHFH